MNRKSVHEVKRRFCIKKGIVSVLLLVGITAGADGALMTYTTIPGGTVNGLPVSAQATFTTTNGQVQIFLENLLANPTSVAQNLNGILFTLDTGQNTGSLGASAGKERWVLNDKNFTDGNTGGTEWLLFTVGAQLKVSVLSTPMAPKHTIVGPPDASNIYSKANKSIAGNDPHNPFLAHAATFAIDVPGVTADSRITAATFCFNTALGDEVPGVPEPTTILLIAMGGLLFLIKK